MKTAPAPRQTEGPTSAFERAKRVGYVIHRGAGKAGERYWRWCRANARPFVMVMVHRKDAEVCCDMTTLGLHGRLFPASISRIDALFGWPRSDDHGPICYVQAGGVALGQAETLAFRLYEIACECDWPPITAAR